jgi:hypothetical protein
MEDVSLCIRNTVIGKQEISWDGDPGSNQKEKKMTQSTQELCVQCPTTHNACHSPSAAYA